MNQEYDPEKSPERRASFRVMDAIGLEYVKLDGEGETDLEATGGVATKRVRVENKYDIEGFADVKRDFPAVADYINSLEERIRTLLLGGEQTAVRPTHRVSLSVSGIAFADKQLLQPGDGVRLRLTLFPGVQTLVCEGTVVNVGQDTEIASGELHTYRIAFSQLGVENQQIIENHVENLRRTVRQPAGTAV